MENEKIKIWSVKDIEKLSESEFISIDWGNQDVYGFGILAIKIRKRNIAERKEECRKSAKSMEKEKITENIYLLLKKI